MEQVFDSIKNDIPNIIYEISSKYDESDGEYYDDYDNQYMTDQYNEFMQYEFDRDSYFSSQWSGLWGIGHGGESWGSDI